MEKAVDHLNQAVELFNRGMNNRKLSSEIKRWSSKFVRGVKLLEDTISYLSEKDKDKLKIQTYTIFCFSLTEIFLNLLKMLIKFLLIMTFLFCKHP